MTRLHNLLLASSDDAGRNILQDAKEMTRCGVLRSDVMQRIGWLCAVCNPDEYTIHAHTLTRDEVDEATQRESSKQFFHCIAVRFHSRVMERRYLQAFKPTRERDEDEDY